MISIDETNAVIRIEDATGVRHIPFGSPEAFRLITDAWLRIGWDVKHVYSFTWMGRPIIQLPEDMIRIQELIYRVRPDVIIETGVAHGGSLVFCASLCKAIGKGRVIGVDIEIRPHNRRAIEAHTLFELITLIEGNSIDPAVVAQVAAQIRADETVLVVLDSKHTKAHVLGELELYSPFVSVGSYIVVQDGIMERLAGAPRSGPDWNRNNPKAAVKDFVAKNCAFVVEQPVFDFNEGVVDAYVTYCPDGRLKRIA